MMNGCWGRLIWVTVLVVINSKMVARSPRFYMPFGSSGREQLHWSARHLGSKKQMHPGNVWWIIVNLICRSGPEPITEVSSCTAAITANTQEQHINQLNKVCKDRPCTEASDLLRAYPPTLFITWFLASLPCVLRARNARKECRDRGVEAAKWQTAPLDKRLPRRIHMCFLTLSMLKRPPLSSRFI